MARPIGPGTVHGARRGAALLASFVLVAVLLCTTWALTTIASRVDRAPSSSAHGLAAESLAEAGISDKISQMIAGNFADLGSAASPAVRAGGSYWVRVVEVDPAHSLYRLTSRSACGAERDALETLVRPVAPPDFPNAIFAGNSSGDADYVLDLGRTGHLADRVRGDVYSGGGVTVTGSAQVDGTIRAARSIAGARGSQGSTQSPPDFAGLRRALRPDFDVAALFAEATPQSSLLGGIAEQMPRESPAHVFRKNPSDREAWTKATPGDDYFLEDPYERLDLESSAVSRLTLGETGVFFVSGDLWIANRQAGALRLESALTIVVQGDIHVAGDVLRRDPERDSLALVAIRDPFRADSGNIFLGEPASGSPARIEAHLFAEEDVLATASVGVSISGCVVAGDHVVLGSAPVAVSFEDRGSASLPGLPRRGGSVAAYTVVSCRRLAAD